jgi:hypothetical protein
MNEGLGTPEGLESAASVHRAPQVCPSPTCAHPRRAARLRGFLFAYDDGNGLWITSGETPFDQGFLGCICPQE